MCQLTRSIYHHNHLTVDGYDTMQYVWSLPQQITTGWWEDPLEMGPLGLGGVGCLDDTFHISFVYDPHFASESLEPRYCLRSDMFTIGKSSTTHLGVIRREMVNVLGVILKRTFKSLNGWSKVFIME